MRRINYLLAGMFIMTTCATTFSAPTQGEVLRPDLIVRSLEVKGKLVTVHVLNKGKAAADGCFVTVAGKDTAEWRERYQFGPVAPGATERKVFDISPHSAKPGTSLGAIIDSDHRVAEMDETNNARELLVPAASTVTPAPAPGPGPAPAPAPQPPPLLSPDIAAANIYFGKFVVVVLKNVGVRDYHAKDARIKDSFMRGLTLRRIVHIGATSTTEVFPARFMGSAAVGQSFNANYPLPKQIAGATKYTWILTIEGDDPNKKNNTFTKVQEIVKID